MQNNNIQNKSIEFAIRIVNLYKYLTTNSKTKEFVLSKQLLRSGTSVGAMIREAEFAESKADFIHKYAISQKECNETIYWLELLHKTEYLSQVEYDSLSADAVELIKIITAIILKRKKNRG